MKEEMEEKNGVPEPLDITVMLSDFFRILRKNWLVILLIAAVTAAGFGFYRQHTYEPTYTASSTYVVTTTMGSSSGNYYDTAVAQQISETFPYILTSQVLQRKVAQALEVSSVPGVIRASAMEGTNLLTISVTDTDPQRAARTLQAVLETYPSISESIIGKVFMELMDETGIPTQPDNPMSLKADLVKGCMIGLLVSFAGAVILMLNNRTIRCEDDCLNRVNTRCIGVIPRIREKVRSRKVVTHLSILQKNADPEFVEAFRIIRNKIDHRSDKHSYKSVLITSTLAGEGKSTIAVNVALSLVQEGKRVALVDCDLRNPSDSAILNAPQGPGLVDFLSGRARLEECTLRGSDILPYNLPLLFIRGGEPVQDGSAYLSNEKMKYLVHALEAQMDYVILDTPPAGLLTDAGILSQYADGVVFVVKKDFAKVDKILEGMEHLTQGNVDILGCVLNGDE